MAQLPDGWTPQDKLAAVLESARLTGAKLDDFIRQRGIGQDQLVLWRSQMLAALDTPPPAAAIEPPPFLTRILQIIDESLADETFQVGALAARLAMSRSLLYQRLREIGQPPPARLILERRLVRAAALLACGGASVSEIAYKVGFASASYFTYCFRQRYGVAPSVYRD